MGLIASIFGKKATAAPTQPIGVDGVQSSGGYVQTGERNPALIGQNLFRTNANALNQPIIATAVRGSADLIGGVPWYSDPNPNGHPDAQRAADIVTQGLLTALMPDSWRSTVRKAHMFRYDGAKLFNPVFKQRTSDGMWVYASLGHRPIETIEKWNRDTNGEIESVDQRTPDGKLINIPRANLFYCVDKLFTNSPAGSGLLRHVVELVRRLNIYEAYEGSGFERDLRGVPIGRAPIGELRTKSGHGDATPEEKAKQDQYVADRTRGIKTFLENIVKDPAKLQWLLLPSDTYEGVDQNAITAVQKWALDLVRGDGTGLAEVDAVIRRLQLEIARVFGWEFALVGGSGSTGTYGAHADKTNMVRARLDSTLDDIGEFATRDVVRPLLAFNGLDPDRCCPVLRHDPISSEGIDVISRALASIALAGLAPNDKAIPALRQMMNLPPPPEPTPGMLGMLPRPPVGGPPDPAKGEEDVELDDLGAQPTTKRRRTIGWRKS